MMAQGAKRCDLAKRMGFNVNNMGRLPLKISRNLIKTDTVMKLAKLKKWLGNLPIFSVSQRTFSADTMEELEQIWQNDLMNNGWDVKKPLDVRFNWRKFDYEYYFVAKYVG